MQRLEGRTFLQVAVVGAFATAVMTIVGILQAGVGLVPVDMGAMLARGLNRAHAQPIYGVFAGNLLHVTVGIVFAVMFWAFFAPRVRRGWLVKGLVYAGLLALLALLLAIPLLAGTGVFFTRTTTPLPLAVSLVLMHVAYALALTLGLRLTGLEGAPLASDEAFAHSRAHVGLKTVDDAPA